MPPMRQEASPPPRESYELLFVGALSQMTVGGFACYNGSSLMPTYKVLYLKDQSLIDKFQSHIPTEGPASLKPKDYAQVAEIEAPNEYAVWKTLQGDGATERQLRPMVVGDALEVEAGKPRVCRFAGFDDAVWFTFEPKKTEDVPPVDAPNPPADSTS